MHAHRAEEHVLAGERITPEWRAAIASAVGRTRGLFKEGSPLCDRLRGRLGYEIRLTWLGGTRILDRLEAVRFDVLSRRPTIGSADVSWLAATALAGPRFIRKRAART
jgi:phytoene synthase